MADLIGKVKRYMSEKITSVEDSILSYQEGFAAGKVATANTFIPCNIEDPTNVVITPIYKAAVSLTDSASDNGKAFFTTIKGWEVASLLTLSGISDLDAWVQTTIKNVGYIFNYDGVAYITTVGHTSSTGGTEAADFATDLALGVFKVLPYTTFLKIIHEAPAATKVANFRYKIEGYKVN